MTTATSSSYPPPPPYYRLYKDYERDPASAPDPPAPSRAPSRSSAPSTPSVSPASSSPPPPPFFLSPPSFISSKIKIDSSWQTYVVLPTLEDQGVRQLYPQGPNIGPSLPSCSVCYIYMLEYIVRHISYIYFTHT
uniref:Mediator of RNA polymerase II transcription subunit 7 n=1 Tax=Ananas comosus var. bracteatus TaxID=296719 RepID=A0A6V7PSS6_ANACO|nr:unnamed protein product [Ananas comosus var. bracteatus]